jgi:hypothetical protein
MENNKADRLNWIIAGAVTLISLIVYLKTLAVSISLWDCGEFVACSRIFGVAHPPGTPLFIIFGRIFSLIPFAEDIAYRINLVSALSSAFAVGFSYLILSKVIGWWLDKKETIWDRLPAYLGGFVGALVMAFSRTWWTNAVEAEVYGLTSLLSIAVVYLAVVWYERRKEPRSDKLVFLMIFLAVLGVAAHLAAYLVMPAVFLFIFLSSRRLLVQPLVWISVLCAMLLAIDYNLFFTVILIWSAISLIGAFATRKYFWRWAAAFSVCAALAFSIQYTTLFRAQERPRINMTNANTLERMNDYLARKQYGQGNMITRMFDRRGELDNQFGDYPRMGMLGFWEDQYSPPSAPFIIWFVLGLFGLYFALHKKWKVGLLIFLLVLAGTVGITLYMNFADGTEVMQDPNAKLEVRDRDYFWTHGFAMFGWAIGLGVAALLYSAQNFLRSRENMQKLVIPVTLLFCLTIFIPALGYTKNHYYNNRSGEWMPYQFAYDLLSILEPNAVLFTAGDNDTYPLWALQEAYGMRQDVKIINLSLANVDWYVLHCMEVFGAPMSVSHEQVEVVENVTPTGNEKVRPEKPYYDQFNNRLVYFGTRPIRDPGTGRVTDIIEMAQLTIESVIQATLEQRGDTLIMNTPVYFTSLTDPVRKMRYTNLLQNMERVAYLYKIKDTVIVGETKPPSPMYPYHYNVDRSYDLYANQFIFEGMGEPEVARGEFTTMMVYRYYSTEYATLIDSLKARNDTTRLVTIIDKAVETVPEFHEVPDWRMLKDSLLGNTERSLTDYQNEYVEYMRLLLDYHPYNFYYKQFISEVLLDMGQAKNDDDLTREALSYLQSGYHDNPNSEWMFEGLLKGSVAIRDTSRLEKLMREYIASGVPQPFRPVFLLAADYLEEKSVEDLTTLMAGYFRASGKDPFVFKELVKYTMAKKDIEATVALQKLYFEIHPDDHESMQWLLQMFPAAEDEAPSS